MKTDEPVPEGIDAREAELALNKWAAVIEARAVRDSRLEETTCRRILKYMGVKDTKAGMRKMFMETYGSSEITFAAVAELYHFPIFLTAANLPYIYNITVPELMSPLLPHLPMMKEYDRVLSEVVPATWDGSVGLVFKWPKVANDYGIMVLHNHSTATHDDFTRITRRIRGVDYTMEQLEGILRTMFGDIARPDE